MSVKNNQIEIPFTQGDKDKLDSVTTGAQPQPATASQAEAEAGTDNVKMMTALRVLESIQANAGSGGGEANTASNVGTGTGIFKQKTGVNLEFKTLVAGSGVTITPGTSIITISASAGGLTNTDGLAEGSTNLYFTQARVTNTPAVLANTAKISASGSINTHSDVSYSSPLDGQVLTWSTSLSKWTNQNATGGSGEANTASNVGSGTGLFKGKVGVDLQFKSLIAGTNITLTPGTNDVTIDAASGGSGHLTQYLTFDSGNISIKLSGSSSDISSVTATKDFSQSGISRLLLNRPSTVQYHSIVVTFTAGETTGRTQCNVEMPEPNGQTNLSQAIRPIAFRLNSSENVASTGGTIALSGTTVILTQTGYTGGMEQRIVVQC